MIREFSISCDFSDVTLVGDGVTKAIEPLESYSDMNYCKDKGRIFCPQNTLTNYEQAKFSRQSSNQLRSFTEGNIAEYKAK